MDGTYELFRSFWVVWLGLIFLGIVVWALWPGNRGRFAEAANIPLADDGEPSPPQSKGRT